ncbi:hypothetical protein BY458DRAFT_283653 [Sporodiniella umbellata]|nr:hypothetical protein BY458DRAFT_283653 [Sporodiniella umbellata]
MEGNNKLRNKTLKKLAKWAPSSNSRFKKSANITPFNINTPLLKTHHDQLQQGSLYILKIKKVTLALFEGWDDEMCCFSILRADADPMRWSETRQLIEDFDAYDAFDSYGNPPIHLWSRYLRTNAPMNWFCMFEEARRKQRTWLSQHEEHAPGGVRSNCAIETCVSNADVSTMILNPQESNFSSNIIDPDVVAELQAMPIPVTMHKRNPAQYSSDREHIRNYFGSNQEVLTQSDIHSPLSKESMIKTQTLPGYPF